MRPTRSRSRRGIRDGGGRVWLEAYIIDLTNGEGEVELPTFG